MTAVKAQKVGHHPCEAHADRRRACPTCADCGRECVRCGQVKAATEFRARQACRTCHTAQNSRIRRSRAQNPGRGSQKDDGEAVPEDTLPRPDGPSGLPWPEDVVERVVMLALWTSCNSHQDEPDLPAWMLRLGRLVMARLDRAQLEKRLVAVSFVRDAGDLGQLVEQGHGTAPRWRGLDVVVGMGDRRQRLIELAQAFRYCPTAMFDDWARGVQVDDFLPFVPAEGSRGRIPLPFARLHHVMAPAVFELRSPECEARRVVCRAVQSAAPDGRRVPTAGVTWASLLAALPEADDLLPGFLGVLRDKARLFHDDTLRWVNRSGRWVGADGKSGGLREIDAALAIDWAEPAKGLRAALTQPRRLTVEVNGPGGDDPRLDDELECRRQLLRCALDLAAVCPDFAAQMARHGPITLRTLERETNWNRQTVRGLVDVVAGNPRFGLPRKPPLPVPPPSQKETEEARSLREFHDLCAGDLPRHAPMREARARGKLLVARPLPGGDARAMMDPANLAVMLAEEGGMLWPGYSRVLGTAPVF